MRKVLINSQGKAYANNNNILVTDAIVPSGTKSITANGTYDVTEYASASVNVQQGATDHVYTVTSAVTATTDSPYGNAQYVFQTHVAPHMPADTPCCAYLDVDNQTATDSQFNGRIIFKRVLENDSFGFAVRSNAAVSQMSAKVIASNTGFYYDVGTIFKIHVIY